VAPRHFPVNLTAGTSKYKKRKISVPRPTSVLPSSATAATAARHMAMLRPCEAGSELAALTLSQAIVNVPAEIERRQFCRVEIIFGSQFQKEKFHAKETLFFERMVGLSWQPTLH